MTSILSRPQYIKSSLKYPIIITDRYDSAYFVLFNVHSRISDEVVRKKHYSHNII